MQHINKINYRKQDENSSYFVIDLKKEMQKEEGNSSRKDGFFEFFERLAEQGFAAYFKKMLFIVKGKLQSYFYEIFFKIKKIKNFSFFVFIFTLFKFFGKLFYIIFFKIGWLVLFFARFTYILFFTLGKKIVNVIFAASNYLRSAFLFPIFKKEKQIYAHKNQEYLYPEKISHSINANKIRSIIIFVVALFVIVLPLKAFTYYKNLNNVRGKVLGASEKAIDSFLSAAESIANMDFSQAKNNFSFADSNFGEAKKELEEINSLIFALSSVSPNKSMRLASNGKNILIAGELAAKLGENLSATLDNLVNKNKDDISAAIETLIVNSGEMIEISEALEKQIGEIDIKDLPDDYKEQFILLKNKSSLLSGGLKEFVELIKGVNVLLGAKYDKRYLLVFQNNAELRATGGFIGSFALIDFREGKIKNIETPGGGSYDTEAGLKTLVSAPEPLHLVNPLWHFWDANWWPDWPTSANKLMWFYEKSDGPTVDGVISLTPTILEKILEITGPIDMSEKYGVVLDHNNFWQTVQAFAEQKQDVTREPKKIIGDMAAKLIEELPQRLDKDVLLKLVGAIGNSLNQKHVLFYFTDNDLQKKVDDYGWSGKIKNSSRDYLSVINTNIAGGKSDKKIKETIRHEAKIMNNGFIIDTVKIERVHTGIKNEQFTGVRNVDWMRIYVPLGSELLEVSGFERPDDIYFDNPDPSWQKDPELERVKKILKIDDNSGTEIYEESGHTVFANWSMVDPGETAVIYLKYRLPFKLTLKNNTDVKKLKFWEEENVSDYYSLLAQKQSGSMPSVFVSDLVLPEETVIIWSYPDSNKINIQENSWRINTDLNIDKYWAVILK